MKSLQISEFISEVGTDNGTQDISSLSESESSSVVSDSLWPHGHTVHGIHQARILEWVAIPFSRESSQPRDQTQVSHIAGRFFTSWITREAQGYWSG